MTVAPTQAAGANGQPWTAMASSDRSDRYAAVTMGPAMAKTRLTRTRIQASRAAMSMHRRGRPTCGYQDVEAGAAPRLGVQLEHAADGVGAVSHVRQAGAGSDL